MKSNPRFAALSLLLGMTLLSSSASANFITHNDGPAFPPGGPLDIVAGPLWHHSDINNLSTNKTRVANRFTWNVGAGGFHSANVRFWGGINDGQPNSGVPNAIDPRDIRIRIYNGPFAGSGPTTLIQEYNFNNLASTANFTPNFQVPGSQYDIKQYDVHLAGLGNLLTEGNQYWIEIADNDPDTSYDQAWGWWAHSNAPSATSRGYHWRGSDAAAWTATPTNHYTRAFMVTAVPEPGAMALLGLCGIGGVFYRRRKGCLHNQSA